MFATARRFTALLFAAAALAVTVPLRASDAADAAGTVRVGGRPQKDVVIWLEGVPAGPSVSKRAVLDQRNLTFAPHVLAIKVGTTVSMPNNDRVFHNVFSFRDGKRFDLGLYPVGRAKLVTFDRAGVSRIFCNIHPNMAAYVVVVDSDHYGVSNENGEIALAGVPDGAYTYHAWRAGHDPVTGRVVIAKGRRMEIDVK